MKIGLLGGLLAALLSGLGLGGDWDADDRAPARTAVCPDDGPCAPYVPPKGPPTAVCPDDGPCAPWLPPRGK